MYLLVVEHPGNGEGCVASIRPPHRQRTPGPNKRQSEKHGHVLKSRRHLTDREVELVSLRPPTIDQS